MKIKFGAIVTDGRGKIGGHVASKNRAGAYLRTKVTPSNPNTTAQADVRNRLANLSQNWRSLTQDQRNAWNSAVSSFAKTDIFGDIKNPSGINLYVKLNANLDEIGVAAMVDPPSPASVWDVEFSSLVIDTSAPTFSVEFLPSPVPSNSALIIRATKQVSPGVNFIKNLYRNIMVIDAAGTSPINALAAYESKFGTLVAGLKTGVELVAVNKLTGQKGVAVSLEEIATP